MKRIGWSAILVMTIILTACGSPAPTTAVPAVPTLTEVPVTTDMTSNVVVASARAVPVQVANIGFVISGIVKDVAVKEGDTVQAGQVLAVLDSPELEYAVAAAEASLRAAQADLATRNRDKYKYIDRYDRVSYSTVPNEVVQMEKAKVQAAQSELDLAKASLAQAALVAPYEATVVSISIIPGELAQGDQAVLTLASLNELQIETTDLSERDISRVQIGRTVNVFIEALNSHLTGKVLRISPISEIVGGDVVYKVTIGLDQQTSGLLWGMTAEVEIQAAP